mgnify:CR=1 FL=1
MKNYKNSKAIECIKEAQAIEEFVAAETQKLQEKGLPFLDYYCELMTEAAGLRVLADDIEDGLISVEELNDV